MDFIDLTETEFSEEAYGKAIDSLFAQVPTFQRSGASAYKPGLDASIAFDQVLGEPSKALKCIHIAGTNGKGSTSSMLAAMLQSQGYRVGLYTSPHLVDFRERIRISGTMVPKEYVFGFLRKWGKYIISEKISFFEITTALAFSYFRDEKVDIAVIETGLGGRLDSTNILSPLMSVITNIGFDHCDFLGHTLAAIASEKAGIIKPGIPAVLGESDPEYISVFEEKAKSCGTKLYVADRDRKPLEEMMHYLGVSSPSEIRMGLTGECQQKNLVTVLTAAQVLNPLLYDLGMPMLSRESILAGIEEVTLLTGLRGRWECICREPRIYCDTGHNAHGLKYVFHQLSQEKYDKLYVVFGVVADKDLDAVIPLMAKDAYYIFTNAKGTRALPASKLEERMKAHGFRGESVDNVKGALERAKSLATNDDFIYVGGSTFVVAEIL